LLPLFPAAAREAARQLWELRVLHKQWIESAARTTCSEMSHGRLQEGIYQLLARTRGQWRYVRRTRKVRTRLFLVKGGRARGELKNAQEPEARP
jgi:hypothetical protein